MWTVQTLQKKGADGAPAAKFCLCASSDEGGGFVEGCSHDHVTAAEADACPLARHTMSVTTGMPFPATALTPEDQAHLDSVIRCETAGDVYGAVAVEIGARTLPVYFTGDAEAAIAAIEAKAAEFVALLDSLRTPVEEAPPYVEGDVAIPQAVGIMDVEVNLAIQHAHEAEMWAMKLLRRRR